MADRARVVALAALCALAWAALPALAAPQSTAEVRRDPAAAEPPPASSAERLDAYIAQQIESRWWKRRESLSRGGHTTAGPTSAELLDFMRVEGIRRLPELADAVVLEGEAQRRVGNLSAAREAFRFAIELDPESPAAWWGAARAHWASGDGVKTFASYAWMSIVTRLGSFWTRYVAAVNLLFIVVVALGITALATLLTLFVREAPALVHAVDERLPATWHAAWRTTAGWAVILAPIGLAFVGLWAVVLWAAAMIAVAEPRGRRLLVTCLVALALVQPAVRGLVTLGAVTTSSAARVAVDAAEGAWRPDNTALFARLERERPEEALWKHLLARALKLRDPDRTVALLREACDLDPGDLDLKVLLANTFFRLGKNEKAGVLYREVIESDADNVLARFNLSRVRLALFEFDEAEALLTEVRRDEPKMLAAMEKGVADGEVVDPELRAGGIARSVVFRELSRRSAGLPLPTGPLSIAAVAAVVLGLALAGRGRDLRLDRCVRCGDGVCGRCLPRNEEGAVGAVCRACLHLAERGSELAPGARREQTRRIEGFQARARFGRTALRFAWPGLTLVYDGRGVAGIILAAAWIAALLALLAPEALVPSARPVGASVVPLLAGATALVVWLLAWTPALRLPRPGGGGH